MPFVNIKITREAVPVTAGQKAEVIAGVTDLLHRVLGRGPSTTVVVIEEVGVDDYGVGGETVRKRRERGA